MQKFFITLAVISLAASLAGCKKGESLMYPDPSITVTTLQLPTPGN